MLPFPGVGGTEFATLRIARAVSAYGVESLAVCLEPTDSLRAFLAAGGLRIIEAGAPQPSFRQGVRFLRESWELSQRLKALSVDLVHCADVLAAYHVSTAGWMAGVPVLSHVRNRYADLPWRETLFMRPVDHFAFVSYSTWRQFALTVPERRGTVVYDGVQAADEARLKEARADAADVRREFGLPCDAMLVGMFARISAQKDHPTLIRAASETIARCPQAYFLLVGGWSSDERNRAYHQQVADVIQQAGLTERVRLTGFREDVARLMGAIDILALSTHAEGLPLVLLEGMALGKPVVATDVDGIPELVENGVSGFLCRHSDSAALAASLIRLMENPGLMKQMGAAGLGMVRRKFSEAQFAESLINLYAKVSRRR